MKERRIPRKSGLMVIAGLSLAVLALSPPPKGNRPEMISKVYDESWCSKMMVDPFPNAFLYGKSIIDEDCDRRPDYSITFGASYMPITIAAFKKDITEEEIRWYNEN